jgi:hypothetical protein
MSKLFFTLNSARKASLVAHLASAGLQVTTVAGGAPDEPTESAHTLPGVDVRLRVVWPAPPTPEQVAAASTALSTYTWT